MDTEWHELFQLQRVPSELTGPGPLQVKMLSPPQPPLAEQTKPFTDTLSSQGHTNRAGHGSLELTSLTICSWTLLLACRNACCSSLRKFSDFWHLAMSKEILKKENPDTHVRKKAWNRFWKRNKFSCLLLLPIGTSKFQTNPLKFILILHSVKQECSSRQLRTDDVFLHQYLYILFNKLWINC